MTVGNVALSRSGSPESDPYGEIKLASIFPFDSCRVKTHINP